MAHIAPLILQFGHGGEAVETTAIAAAATLEALLQFGHGGEAVETRAVAAPERRRELFNSATAVRPWRRPTRLPRPNARPSLQFGHGGEAVETRPAVGGEVAPWPGLQFGHGGEAVETRPASRRGRRRRFFNSATAV